MSAISANFRSCRRWESFQLWPYFRRLEVGKKLQSNICIYIWYIYISYIIHHISHIIYNMYIYSMFAHLITHFHLQTNWKNTKNIHPHIYEGTNCPPPPNRQPLHLKGLRHLRWYRSETGRRQPDMWRLREGMVREDDPFFIHDCCTKNVFSSGKTAEFRQFVLWLFDILRRKPWLQMHEVRGSICT